MLSRRQLISKVVEKFGEDMVVLSSPGIGSILAFRSSAAKVFHMLPDDTDDMSEVVEKVLPKRSKLRLKTLKRNYHSHVDKDICLKHFKATPSMMYCQV